MGGRRLGTKAEIRREEKRDKNKFNKFIWKREATSFGERIQK